MQYPGRWVLVAGWAAKWWAIGQEGGWGVPTEGGGNKRGAILEADYRAGSFAMGKLAVGLAARVGNGQGLTALQGSHWQATIASQS